MSSSEEEFEVQVTHGEIETQQLPEKAEEKINEDNMKEKQIKSL